MKPTRPLLLAGASAASLFGLARSALPITAMLLAALHAWGSPLEAQTTGWIVVSEPGEWGDNRTLTVASGTRIRVVGQAFHSSGIQAITVGGQAAEVRPGVGGVVDFEGYLTIAPGMTNVSVEARPTSGEVVRRAFNLNATGGAPAGGGQPARGAQPSGAAAPAATTVYSPGSAAARSIIPGLGQIYTKRPVLGMVFLGGAVGAGALGVLSKKTTVRCLAPLEDGSCPAGQEHSRVVEKPYQMLGIGGVAAIAAVAAIEAYSAAKRMNRQSGADRQGGVPSWLERATPTFDVTANGYVLGLRVSR